MACCSNRGKCRSKRGGSAPKHAATSHGAAHTESKAQIIDEIIQIFLAEVDRIEQDAEINKYTFVDTRNTVLDEVKLFFNYHSTLGSDSRKFCDLVAASRDSNPIRLNKSDYKTGLERAIRDKNILPNLKTLFWDILQDAIQFIGSKDASYHD